MSLEDCRRAIALVAYLCAAFRSEAQISINEVIADNQDVATADGSISDWVELYNSSAQPFNIAGFSLTDSSTNPRKWVVPQNVTIPANGFLLVLLDSTRPASANVTPPLNAGFSIRTSGDQVELYSPASQLVDRFRFGPQAANFSIGRVPAGVLNTPVLCAPTPESANVTQPLGQQTGLKINEWMASPSSGDDWFEIYNPDALPVQLSGLAFTDDGNEPSPVAPLSFIGAGNHGWVRFYADNSTNDNEVAFKLGAGGDSITLSTLAGAVIDSVRFGQQSAGVSEGRLPDGSPERKFLNMATPGESNLIRYEGLVVNEVLSHTDPPLSDAVEFYNQTTAPIDIGGWYLSNSRGELKKYRVPDKTIVPAKDYIVFYEGQFNRTGDMNAFTLNSAHGDQVYLAEADSNGGLTGRIVSETFEAAENAVSFGRYESSVAGDYKFVAMERPTFGVDRPSNVQEFESGKGALNSKPLVGPVVINEIMYHPPELPDGSDNTVDEYVELHNTTSRDVPLYDINNPTNPWHLQGAVKFDFPTGTTLPPGGYALLVSFNPATNASALNAFRAKFAVPSGAPVFGPYSGKLSNSGDPIELYKPDPPQLPPHSDAGFVPYIRVDKVNYRDAAPWPTEPDGSGKSLQRKNSTEFGNDPSNWQAGATTAGRSNSAELADSDGDGMPDSWETQNGFDPNNGADGAADADTDGLTNFQEYIAGTDPKNAASGLRLVAGPVEGSGVVNLRFSSVPEKSYSVQFRNSLLPTSTWETLVSTNAAGSEVTVRDPNSAGLAQRFYRLVTPSAN